MFDKFDKAYLEIISECGNNLETECDDTQVNECDDTQINECDDIQTEDENNVGSKIVTFSTDNQQLIDILSGTFDKVVFYVTSEDEDGEEITDEIEITPDAFKEVSIEDEDNAVNEGLAGAAGGAIAGGLAAGPIGAIAGGLLGSEL